MNALTVFTLLGTVIAMVNGMPARWKSPLGLRTGQVPQFILFTVGIGDVFGDLLSNCILHAKI